MNFVRVVATFWVNISINWYWLWRPLLMVFSPWHRVLEVNLAFIWQLERQIKPEYNTFIWRAIFQVRNGASSLFIKFRLIISSLFLPGWVIILLIIMSKPSSLFLLLAVVALEERAQTRERGPPSAPVEMLYFNQK